MDIEKNVPRYSKQLMSGEISQLTPAQLLSSIGSPEKVIGIEKFCELLMSKILPANKNVHKKYKNARRKHNEKWVHYVTIIANENVLSLSSNELIGELVDRGYIKLESELDPGIRTSFIEMISLFAPKVHKIWEHPFLTEKLNDRI
jgi:hypothetical protein